MTYASPLFSKAWLDSVFGVGPTRPRKKPNPPRKLRRYTVLGHEYAARDRSEARSMAKAALKLDRLPAGTRAVRSD